MGIPSYIRLSLPVCLNHQRWPHPTDHNYSLYPSEVRSLGFLGVTGREVRQVCSLATTRMLSRDIEDNPVHRVKCSTDSYNLTCPPFQKRG